MANRIPLIIDSTSKRIKELPSGDNLDLTGNGISAVRDIIPEADVTYNLGSASKRWNSLYVSGNTIFVGDASISVSATNIQIGIGANTATIPVASSQTFASLNGTETLTNKTINLANNTLTATSAQILAAVSDETGTGSLVFNTSPTFAGTANFAAISTTGNATVGGNLTVTGDITVNGTTTTVNSTTITVDDINIELGSVATPTDVTAAGGGITLKGTTDKTISWSAANGWTSSETFNIATGKTYKINGTDVLSATTLGSGITGSSLTSVGTITSGTWSASFGAVSGANLTNLTAGNLTGTIPSAVLGNSTVYVGTTAVPLNRASANLALTGISSVALPGSTSGTITVTPAAVAGTTAITIPATSGTLVTTGDTETVTNAMLVGSIANAKLANSSVTVGTTSIALGASSTTLAGLTSVTSTSFVGALTGNASTATTLQTARTINGVSFDGSANITVTATATNALTIGTGLSGTSYNGSSAVTIAIDSTVATLTGSQTLTNKTLTQPTIDNIKMGYTTTATAAGTTTLTSSSNYYQVFTGSTTQTVVLPVTSTLSTGWSVEIENNSSGNLTVNSSGGNLVVTVIPGSTAHILCIGTTLTTAADWDADFTAFSAVTGTGSVVLSQSATMATPTFTGTTTASALTATGTISFSSTTSPVNLGTSATSGVLTIGGTSGTGTITLGRSTVSQQTDIQAGATASGSTKTINVGTGGLSGSTTNINFGSAVSGATGTATFNNDVVVTGNLTVNGTTTTVNSTTVTVDDINIELGSVASPTDVTAAGGGITLKGTTDKTISWSAANGWTSSEDLNLATGKVYKINGTSVLSATTLGSGVTGSSLTSVGTITSGTWQGTAIANAYLANNSITIGSTAIGLGASTVNLAGLTSVTSTSFVGALVGNASTATTLQTARTINGVSFDGSANITVTSTATNALTIGTGLTGTSYNGSSAVTIAIDSTVTTLTGSQTLTNKTLTSPAITTPTVTGATILKTGSTNVADEYVAYLNATATTAGQVLDSIPTASYSSVRYTIEALTATNIEIVDVVVGYIGTTVYMNDTVITSSTATFQATYDADINAGNLRLLVTPANANTKFKVRATAFKII